MREWIVFLVGWHVVLPLAGMLLLAAFIYAVFAQAIGDWRPSRVLALLNRKPPA